MRTIPSTQSYSVIGPVRQGFVRASCAGARSWVVLALSRWLFALIGFSRQSAEVDLLGLSQTFHDGEEGWGLKLQLGIRTYMDESCSNNHT